jgi:hypothetical protein
MALSGQAAHVTAFTHELLRTGVMLSGVAADLIELLPSDAYPGEDPAAVVLEMVVGSVQTAIGGASQEELERATELIAVAADRIVEHLQLALVLSRRMHGIGDDLPGRNHG